MDIEDAIKRLEKFWIRDAEQEDYDAVSLAIDALEKQIKISRVIKNGKYYCPKCDAEMKTSGFCRKCGQKLY